MHIGREIQLLWEIVSNYKQFDSFLWVFCCMQLLWFKILHGLYSLANTIYGHPCIKFCNAYGMNFECDNYFPFVLHFACITIRIYSLWSLAFTMCMRMSLITKLILSLTLLTSDSSINTCALCCIHHWHWQCSKCNGMGVITNYHS